MSLQSRKEIIFHRYDLLFIQKVDEVFNCGIGMVLVVAAADAAGAKSFLEARGETVYRLGEIAARAPGDAAVEMDS